MPQSERRLLDALLDAFNHKSVDRGRAYFHQQRVQDVRIERDAEETLVLGRVRGTASRPYTVSLILDLGEGDLLDCDCSCPLGGDCKHGVAVLMQAASELGLDDTRTIARATAIPSFLPWEQWLARATTPQAMPPDREEWRLGFVFNAEAQAVLPRLTVNPVVLSRLKNGGWGKPEPLLRGAWEPQPLAHLARLDDEQYALIAALRMQGSGYGGPSETFRFDGRGAQALLDNLLASQACYWQQPRAGEIHAGPPRPLQWRWQASDGGWYRLQAEAASASLQWLRAANQVWYFDPTTQELGPTGMAADQAEKLLSAPALHPTHGALVAVAWSGVPALADVPAPPTLQHPPRTLATAPVPIIRFGVLAAPVSPARVATRQSHAQTIFNARLDFDYDGHRLTASGALIEQRLIEGELLLIQRDAAAQARAAQTLRDLALVPASEHRALPWNLHQRVHPDDFLLRDSRNWQAADALLELHAPLVAAGFRIECADDFPIRLLDEPTAWYGEVDDTTGNEWFDLELGIEVEGQRVPLLPILQRALDDRRLRLQPAADEPPEATWLAPLDAHRRVPIPLARVRAWLLPLLEWLSHAGGDSVRVPRLAGDVLTDLRGAGLPLHGEASVEAFAQRLRKASRAGRAKAPAGLRTRPRPYQLDGLRWLSFLAETGLGGVLADDMGLGKTLQILMHLLAEKRAGRLDRPALVVCPTSVVGNWRDQAARHAPGLRVLVLHGNARAAHFPQIPAHDLVITTYALLPRDRDALLEQAFALAVFDEAQAIKNPAAQAAKIARELPADRRLAVTGTPLENHLGELWAQIDCVLPGLLGGRDHFNRHYRTPIEKHGDGERQARLNHRIAPFLLRRSKEVVAPELPAKTVIERGIELGGRQRDLYETLRLAMHDKVRTALARRGLAQSNIIVLDALLKLRQVCCDPRLVKLGGAAGAKAKRAESAKLDALLPMLSQLVDEGRRILLFSQFTGMLDLIEAELAGQRLSWLRLDGGTRDRDTPVRRFQSGEAPLFLISLKAGGTGLNLTAADTVIHYDPWWNPAVEAQATDRAHRIGQDKPVFVYKLVCAGTVEEKIQALQLRKASLARALLEGGSRTGLKFSEDDIAELFGPG